MTTLDIGPMQRCPFTKSGRHNVCVVTPGDDDGDLTLFCAVCCSIRRVPAKGAISVPLDDQLNVLWQRNKE